MSLRTLRSRFMGFIMCSWHLNSGNHWSRIGTCGGRCSRGMRSRSSDRTIISSTISYSYWSSSSMKRISHCTSSNSIWISIMLPGGMKWGELFHPSIRRSSTRESESSLRGIGGGGRGERTRGGPSPPSIDMIRLRRILRIGRRGRILGRCS